MTRSWLAIALILMSPVAASADKCPNIMFVLDRSGSMDSDPSGGSGKSKWVLLQEAVKKILNAKIPNQSFTYGDHLPFGLEMYTTSGIGGSSCYTDTQIDVSPDHDTAAAIIKAVMAAQPDGITNTGEAIRRAYEDPKMQEDDRAQFIILITDGDPNCNDADQSDDPAYTVGEIAKAAKRPVPVHTFVIGFDGTDGVNPASLNKMAKAGLEPVKAGCGSATNPCYYSASDPVKLNAALAQIIAKVSTGEFGQGLCDDSCLSAGCPTGQVCGVSEVEPAPHCIRDECAGKICDTGNGEFCRGGICIPACLVQCKDGKKCVDGTCVTDPCDGKECGPEFCEPNSGACVTNQCDGVNCAGNSQCDPLTGKCVQDPCNFIVCPQGTACKTGGNCEAVGGSTTKTDGGTTKKRTAPGCNVSPGPDLGGLLLASLGILGMAILLRRRSS